MKMLRVMCSLLLFVCALGAQCAYAGKGTNLLLGGAVGAAIGYAVGSNSNQPTAPMQQSIAVQGPYVTCTSYGDLMCHRIVRTPSGSIWTPDTWRNESQYPQQYLRSKGIRGKVGTVIQKDERTLIILYTPE